ncbi:hypothetical protein RIF29_00003 [Crotalaria pallida]|uniref:Uncharacterized protein n=1 Tax=Crotalaria pallida TaxID=3830 RepID=A0AAN9P712_CROPI
MCPYILPLYLATVCVQIETFVINFVTPRIAKTDLKIYFCCDSGVIAISVVGSLIFFFKETRVDRFDRYNVSSKMLM